MSLDLSAVHALIDTRRDDTVELLRRLIRQPSIASENRGVRECAALLVEQMRAIGIDARPVETAGQPVVYGELKAARPGAPTLLIYNHYDVQPEDPVGEWTHPPFAAEVVGDRIIGRGATDAKGNLVCHLAAARAYLDAAGGPPVNLKFLFDGEEEFGSPSLPGFVEAHKGLLACDFTLAFDGGVDPKDRPQVTFGLSGLLYVYLECQCAAKDLHSARARLVPNPAWRLVWALATMKGEDERIRIGGFYDDIQPPDAADRRLIEALDWDDAALQEVYGVSGFLTGVAGKGAAERLLFQPTCNLAGFRHGYAGEGAKTVLPHRARAYIDFRLVWRQDPEDIIRKLRRHLDAQGFDDVGIKVVQAVEPSKCPADTPVGRATVAAAAETYRCRPVVRPNHEASGREACWLAAKLGVAGLETGVGPPIFNGHAPNEFMTVGHLQQGVHYATNIWARLAEEGARP